MQKIGELVPLTVNRLTVNDVPYKGTRLTVNGYSPKVAKVQHIADRLVEEYREPKSRQYFLKVAWHLSEAQIWDLVEVSRNKKKPISYFLAVTKRLLAEA